MEIKKKSPLLEEKDHKVEPPKYTKEEETYLKGLRKKLETARDNRDTSHDEFDGMSYAEYYELNERLANTYIRPKRNKDDTNFQSGTIRTKLFALLSNIVNLDLSGDISAFNKHGFKVQQLGDAMEDISLKTNELDNDDEKKVLRQYELLKQGTVFVEELWDEKKKKQKVMKGKFKGKIDVTWETKIKDAFARPTRNIVPGVNVYLGDITKYNISEQPFVFTVDVMPYEEAKLIFGEWDRWKHVSKELRTFQDLQQNYPTQWRLLDSTENNQVEIVRYQDKWNNEFAVIINGVLMTPVGLPLPWGYEDYNIAQQNLEPIKSHFAYGKSMVFRIRNKVAILDEMMKLVVLKTQKSFMPPYLNLTGKILSKRVFMPGKINHGIQPNTLVPVNEKESQGVTVAELNAIEKLQESIDVETVSPIFQGQQARGNPTATEIIEVQRQAKQLLGLVIFGAMMLEWKLEWLRLKNNLANWFNPEDTVVDEMREEIRNKFRQVSVNRPIDGEGRGIRMVVPTEEQFSPKAIMDAEDAASEEQGQPVRFLFLNPEEVKSSQLTWQIVVTPRERRTSETQKLLFRAELADAQVFGPMLNLDYMAEKFASVWGENPKKMFKSLEEVQNEQAQQLQQEETQGTSPVSPSVNLPTPEKALGRQLQTSLAT